MSLPIEILFGIYLGVLAGIIPALIAGVLGFVFKYVTNVSIPALAVVIFAAALAGINGGLLALTDPAIASAERFVVAALVVMMLSLYAHSQGDSLGATLPRYVSLRALRERTLSTDVIDMVGGIGEVTITTSRVDDMEGYPALPAALRQQLLDGAWSFPADLPLVELETRLANRLETEHDLADVSVTIDERARAHVVAAPPSGGLSKRVPSGKRAVSIAALVPTGIARGEAVTVSVGDRTVQGTVLSGTSGTETPAPPAPQSDDEASVPAHRSAPTTTGGDGRVTVAVSKRDATTLLRAETGTLRVRSRGSRREFELVSLLRQAGKRFEKRVVGPNAPLDGQTIASVAGSERGDVTIAALKRAAVLPARDGRQRWVFSPDPHTQLAVGDELFAVGTAAGLDRLTSAVRPPESGANTATTGGD